MEGLFWGAGAEVGEEGEGAGLVEMGCEYAEGDVGEED